MTATLLIGDVRERMAELPVDSVDLIVTSPPFLALRSYLPADHPNKAKEIGSEATPAQFLDTMLALTAEWRRLLAPHGSLCVELGDTYSGSGGAGGDYGEGGIREGQPKFKTLRRKNEGAPGWPMGKSLTGIPTLYGDCLIWGRNLLTGQPSPAGQWRVRNRLVWARPNPPVGALGDKFRPATSYITVACTGAKRWFDLDAVREPFKEGNNGGNGATFNDGVDPRGTRTRFPQRDMTHAGAPPLDWHTDCDDGPNGDRLWWMTTAPYKGWTTRSRREPCGPHDGGERTTSPDCPVHADLPGQLPKALRDARASTASSRNGHSDPHPALWPDPDSVPTDPSSEQTTAQPAPSPSCAPTAMPHSTASSRTDPALATSPVGTPSARKSRRTVDTPVGPALSEPHLDTPSSSTSDDDSADPRQGTDDRIAGMEPQSAESACTCSFHRVITESTSHYATFPMELPQRLIKAMCPLRVCTVCGKPSERIVERESAGVGFRRSRENLHNQAPSTGFYESHRETLGWTDCGHDNWRPGLVCDPFAGSGTTLAAAVGLGRDAIGIDLDESNADLVRERCGMFLEVA